MNHGRDSDLGSDDLEALAGEAASGGPVADASEAVTRRTFRLDTGRSFFQGISESYGRTFFLLIALKEFDAPASAKSLIAGAGGFGMLMSPLLVSIVMKRRWKISTVASTVVAVGGAALVLPLLVHDLRVYVASAMVALAVADLVTVLLAPIYASNYPFTRRGQLVGRSIMVKVASAAVVGAVVGGILKRDIRRWPLVVALGLVAWWAQAFFLRRIPSDPLPLLPTDRSATRRRLQLLQSDSILRNTLASWMFIGMANLMTIPLRVEYLGNPRYGVNADAARIALLTVTVPAVVRLVLTPWFGWVFDRMNFFGLRIAINIAFGLSIGLFFASRSTTGLVVASVAFGIGIAGGDVLWSLWATKFAPRDQVADYMSLHTFSTGMRAVSAPFIGFWLVGSFPARTVGMVCMLMTLVGSAVIVPDMMRTLQRRVKAADRVPN